jgi:hypothetical protein
VVAVRHSILVSADHILRDRPPARAVGAAYVARLEAARLERSPVTRRKQRGSEVMLTPNRAA